MPRMTKLKLKKNSDTEAEVALEDEALEAEVEVVYMAITTRDKRRKDFKDSIVKKLIIKLHIFQEVTEEVTMIEEDINED